MIEKLLYTYLAVSAAIAIISIPQTIKGLLDDYKTGRFEKDKRAEGKWDSIWSFIHDDPWVMAIIFTLVILMMAVTDFVA